jgi:thymidylate kinase
MVSFLDEEALWRRCAVSMDDPLVTVPAAEDALLTTLAHYFYEDKCVALLDLLKFAHCLRRGVDWDEVYRVATWRGWRDGLTVSLLLCACQERALYGETLAPSPILERAVRELPGWARTFLERRLGAPLPSLLYEVELPSALEGSRSHHRGAGAGHLASQHTNAVASTRNAESSGTNAARRGELPFPISFVFSKIFFYAKLLRDPTRSTPRKLKDLVVHTANGTKLRLHIHSQPRMLITLSGIDGSGKTTQARMLCSAFEICHLRVGHVWSRGGSAHWLKLVTKWGRKQADADEGTDRASTAQKVRSRQRRFRSPWVSAAWSWLTSVELLLRYARRVTLPLLLGHVVVCDRYVYDTLADWSAYFGEEAELRLAARILRLLTPRPRHRYWLDISPDVAQLRTGASVPKDFVTVQSAAYDRMSRLNGLKRLDGSCHQDVLADQIAYEVLGSYFSDYSTLINHLFLKNPGQWR